MKLFPHAIIQAVCEMLIQSLLWGVALSGVTGLVILATRRQSAKLRYNLLVGMLALFAISLFFSFAQRIWFSEPLVRGNNVKIFQHVLVMPDTDTTGGNNYEWIMGLLRSNANIIVMIWSVVVMIRAVQLLTGLQSLYWMRRRQVFAANADWQRRLACMSHESGIRRLVRLAESGLVKVPMVIGHFKPLILVPVGMLTALPAEVVEAILFHELAHICRQDYLVNILMSSLEIVFFFNPAVLWIITCIRTERENCCDDMALIHTHDQKAYVSALVACREYAPSGEIPFAMGFGARPKPLLARAKRVLTNNNTSLNRVESVVLGLTLLMAVILTAAFSNRKQINPVFAKIKATFNTSHEVREAKHPLIQVKSDAVIHQSPVHSINNTPNHSATFKIYHIVQVGSHPDVTFDNGGLLTRLVMRNETLYQINTRKDTIISIQVNGQTMPLTDAAHYISLIDQAKKAGQDSLVAYKKYAANYQASVTSYHAKSTTYYASSTTTRPEYTPHPVATPAKLAELAPLADPDAQRVKSMISDLYKDGIIASTKGVSFKVGSKGFIVNYQQQPDAVFKKYRDKYVPDRQDGEWDWYYNFDSDKPVKPAIL